MSGKLKVAVSLGNVYQCLSVLSPIVFSCPSVGPLLPSPQTNPHIVSSISLTLISSTKACLLCRHCRVYFELLLGMFDSFNFKWIRSTNELKMLEMRLSQTQVAISGSLDDLVLFSDFQAQENYCGDQDNRFLFDESKKIPSLREFDFRYHLESKPNALTSQLAAGNFETVLYMTTVNGKLLKVSLVQVAF